MREREGRGGASGEVIMGEICGERGESGESGETRGWEVVAS